MLIDPYYKVKAEIHQQRPTQKYIMIGYLCFTSLITAIFAFYFFLVDSNNKCYVREGKDYPEILTTDMMKHDTINITRVSDDFDLLFGLFLVYGFSSSLLCIVNLVGIYYIPAILKLDYPLGIVSKLNMLLLTANIILMHLYRLGHGGKVCSGDYLDGNDPKHREFYLISRGDLLWFWLIFFWAFIGVMLLGFVVALIITLKQIN